jgi:hypothetical protein
LVRVIRWVTRACAFGSTLSVATAQPDGSLVPSIVGVMSVSRPATASLIVFTEDNECDTVRLYCTDPVTVTGPIPAVPSRRR